MKITTLIKRPIWIGSVFLITIALLLFYSCRKTTPLYDQESISVIKNELAKSNRTIKREFDNQNIPADSLKLNEFSDQKAFTIRWEITWDGYFEKIDQDSIGYIYIPMKAYYKINGSSKTRELISTNIKKYILVTVQPKSRSYSLVHLVNDFSNTSKKTEHKLLLFTKNLSNNKIYSYLYVNGKETARKRGGSSGNSAKIMSLTDPNCTVTLFCTFNAICIDGLSVYGTYSYDGYCTYPPYVPGCGEWNWVETREISRECTIDPGLPPGPGLPGGGGIGGGGGGGGGGTTNPDPGPVVDPKDPCEEKATISAYQSRAAIVSKNADVWAKPSNIEWGSNQTISSLDDNFEPVFKITPITPGGKDYWVAPFTWNATDGYVIGTTHKHVDPTGPSPDDVFKMIDNLENDLFLMNSGDASIDYYKRHVSTTVISGSGTYVVTVKNWAELKTSFDTYNLDRTAYQEQYKTGQQAFKLQYPTSTAGAQSNYALLKLLGLSINLYKSDPGTTTFKPLEAGMSNNLPIVRKKPCPD